MGPWIDPQVQYLPMEQDDVVVARYDLITKVVAVAAPKYNILRKRIIPIFITMVFLASQRSHIKQANPSRLCHPGVIPMPWGYDRTTKWTVPPITHSCIDGQTIVMWPGRREPPWILLCCDVPGIALTIIRLRDRSKGVASINILELWRTFPRCVPRRPPLAGVRSNTHPPTRRTLFSARDIFCP
jgi:hypothetical protein